MIGFISLSITPLSVAWWRYARQGKGDEVWGTWCSYPNLLVAILLAPAFPGIASDSTECYSAWLSIAVFVD